jgi:hypothetical protein
MWSALNVINKVRGLQLEGNVLQEALSDEGLNTKSLEQRLPTLD